MMTRLEYEDLLARIEELTGEVKELRQMILSLARLLGFKLEVQ
jgi:hypothetical protein